MNFLLLSVLFINILLSRIISNFNKKKNNLYFNKKREREKLFFRPSLSILEEKCFRIVYFNYHYSNLIRVWIQLEYKTKTLSYFNKIDILLIVFTFLDIVLLAIIPYINEYYVRVFIASYFTWRIIDITLIKLMMILEMKVKINDYSHSSARNTIFIFFDLISYVIAFTFLYYFYQVVSNIDYNAIFLTVESIIALDSSGLTLSCFSQKTIVILSRFVSITVVVLFISNINNMKRMSDSKQKTRSKNNKKV